MAGQDGPFPAFRGRTSRASTAYNISERAMLKFLIWCVLFVLCWPIAIAALVLYPIVWLLLLPFRVVGIAVGSVLVLIWGLVTLPVRVVGKVL
jgi:hypothetical protein